MKNFTSTQLGLLLVLLAVIGGVYYFSQLREEQPLTPSGEMPETYSIAGSVQSINIAENSFVVQENTYKQSFKVVIGAETQMIKLSSSSDIPKKAEITLGNIRKRDQVLVRSSHVVKPGQDITNPLEVQILP